MKMNLRDIIISLMGFDYKKTSIAPWHKRTRPSRRHNRVTKGAFGKPRIFREEQ